MGTPRWVPSTPHQPHRCACIPFIGGHHPEGFFDFGTEIMAFDGHVYVSVIAAKQMAERMGWQPAGGVNPLTRRVNDLEGQVAALEAKLADAERFRESAEHVMSRFGQSIPARKPGRPRAKAAS